MNYKAKNSIKLICLIISVMMLFLLAFNVTYAYFTADKQVSASGNMMKLEVLVTDGTNIIGFTSGVANVYPTDEVIARGSTMYISSTSGGDATNLQLIFAKGSCACYVRYWIDAYISGDTTNYGKYFMIEDGADYDSSDSFVGNDGSANIMYYLETAAATSSVRSYVLISGEEGIKVSQQMPLSALGNTVTLSIKYEIVQKANNAFESVFSDGVYSSDWT